MSFVAPDWKDESVYPAADIQKGLTFWAWQFLRRNPDYQNDWEEYADGLRAMVGRYRELEPFLRWRLEPGNKDEQLSHEDSERLSGLAWKQPEYVVVTPAGTSPRDLVLGPKWGLHALQNPALPKLYTPNRFLISGSQVGAGSEHADSPNHYPVVFDLRMPADVLRSQFKAILGLRDELVKSKQITPYKGRPERSRDNFPNYLRVLDAQDAGAEVSEIANTMLDYMDPLDAKKTVHNWKKAAEEFRSSGYRTMVLHQEIL
jgi:hypothetical protein